MKLKIIGSSSSGNSYVLENDNEILIIEAGIKFSDVQKAIDFRVDKIRGVLISHEHL